MCQTIIYRNFTVQLQETYLLSRFGQLVIFLKILVKNHVHLDVFCCVFH